MSQDKATRTIRIRVEKESSNPTRPYRLQSFEISAQVAQIVIEADYTQRCQSFDDPDSVERRDLGDIFWHEVSKPEYNRAKQWVRNTTGNPGSSEDAGFIESSLTSSGLSLHDPRRASNNADPMSTVRGWSGVSQAPSVVEEEAESSYIWDAIRSLPERECQVLVAVKIQGFTQVETARFMGVSQPMVGRIFKRAIARLEGMLR